MVCLCGSLSFTGSLSQAPIRETILNAPEITDWTENLLSQMQNTFQHLQRGLAQYYVPEGVWRTYRHYGQPVSVREQQDAREFFDNLVDQLDAGLAHRGQPRMIERTFGGLCTDVKTIKVCEMTAGVFLFLCLLAG
jgi:hypothetical protein